MSKGDYILLWQQLDHPTDNDAWWVSKMELFAGPRTTDFPEQVLTDDITGEEITIPAHTVTNWAAGWVGGTADTDTQFIKGGQKFKVTCISNYLKGEVRPNGDIISSQSQANTVNPNAKVSNAALQGILAGENPFRGGVAVTNKDAVQALKDEGFTIIYPESDL